MSFFDPANMFGGGGSRVRDPLGLFGGGRRQMNPQEILQAQQGGGQSIRDGQRTGVGGFGGASGYRGQGMRESDFGGPAEMQQPAPQPAGFGGQATMIRGRMPVGGGGSGVQGLWGSMAGDLGAVGGPQFNSMGGSKPAPVPQGPNPAAMMQSQGQWGQLATALAQQQPRAQPQGISGGLQQFANMNLQRSADPYANPRSVIAQARSSGRGKFADPRG